MNILLEETSKIIREYFGERLENMVVERAVFGLFFSGVKISTGHGGLCFTPVKEIPEAVCCPSSAKAMPLSGKLRGRSVKDYLDDLSHANILRKTLAIATLNALSACYWEENKDLDYKIEMDIDSFDVMKIPQGKKSVVIGALVPMLKKLLAADADFKVLEMDSCTLKGKELDHFAPSKDAGVYLPHADLDVITGVTILNDTLPDLLAMCKPGADILVTGPTAGMLPDAFFKRGVTVMGGILVTKPDELLDIISEGGSGYHFFGKSAERIVIYRDK
ncbi:hypothetical protein HMPREF0491_01537 [Lachnospiraceae oral taxon 107 str. F0167]|nr:hypothetical protein HMPREF0491_01537 [Lachnospiraceae oral taxon 107 str. F0167]